MSLKLAAALVVAATSLSPVAHAATQFYSAQGSLLPLLPDQATCLSCAYMEVWGTGPTPAYANPATDPGDPFNALIASSSALSTTVLSAFTGGSASLGYDPSAAPYFVNPTNGNARYNIPPMTIQISGAGQSPVTLSANDTVLIVSKNAAGTFQRLNFTRNANTVDGPLPGNTDSYGTASSSTFVTDLVKLLDPTTAYISNGFDLSAFTTLPVRLATPTVFRPVGFQVFLRRSISGGSIPNQPPASLSLSDYLSADLNVFVDGVYGVTVDPSDFADSASFAAASNWVSANIRQINFEQSLDYTLSSITPGPVPEPGTWALLLAGLFSVAGVARRRAAGH
jgi:hypothetical protein